MENNSGFEIREHSNISQPFQDSTINTSDTSLNIVEEKIDALAQPIFARQKAELEDRIKNAHSPKSKEIAQHKLDDLNEYAKNLPKETVNSVLSPKDQAKSIIHSMPIIRSIIQFLKKYALEQIHPVASNHQFKQLDSAESEMEDPIGRTSTLEMITLRIEKNEQIKMVQEQVESGEAKRINLYLDDHRQIDGYVIYGNKEESDLKQKGCLVMALGNGMIAEDGYETAKQLAVDLNVNVILYNPPGVGHSLGETTSTTDSVKSCEAAIKYAIKEACTDENGVVDPTKCAVFGHSLGGGISARALGNLREKGIIDKPVGLYVNHHSFSSLAGIGGPLKNLIKRILNFLNFDNLNAKQVLKKTKIADKVVVMTAGKDTVIEKSWGLGTSLEKSKKNKMNEIAYKTRDLGHNDFEAKPRFINPFDPYWGKLEKWSDAARTI